MKIAIVGAGINGLYLGWKLCEKGHKVTIFEKKEIIGKKACSGLLSERIFDFIPQSKELIDNEINSVLIRFPRRNCRVFFSRKFFIMSHYRLDGLVADLAKKAGAKIALNNSIRSLADIPSNFDRIIGCDGWDSTIRKNLRMSEPNFRLGILGFEKKYDKANYVEAWPVKNGFIWKIPRGKETEYGIISDRKIAKPLFDDFQKEKGINLEKMQSAFVPQGIVDFHDNMITTLCGDAAGLTKPWSGGGVIWGLIAADILLKHFPDFNKYQNALRGYFLPKIVFSSIATSLVYFTGFNFPWIFPKTVKIEGDFIL